MAIGGTPDLQIGGLYSSLSGLHWFADLSEGLLPAVTLWSLPLWVYQAVLLVWGAWLAWTLYRWLRSSISAALAQLRNRRQAAELAAAQEQEAAESGAAANYWHKRRRRRQQQ